MTSRAASLVFAAWALLFAATPCEAEPLWALTNTNALLNFDSATPATCTSRPITGLGAGELVLAIDFRPASPFGRLYAITD